MLLLFLCVCFCSFETVHHLSKYRNGSEITLNSYQLILRVYKAIGGHGESSGNNINTPRRKLSSPLTSATAKFFKCFLLLPPRELDGCTATIPRGHSHLPICQPHTGLFPPLLCINIKKQPLPHPNLNQPVRASLDRQAQQIQAMKKSCLSLLCLLTVNHLL